MIHSLHAMIVSALTLQDSTATTQAPMSPCGGGGIESYIPIVLMVGIIYFLMIRPQQKQQKELRKMRDGLKKDDRVVTTGGIHGVISAVKGDIVTLRVADGVKVDFDRSAIVALDRHPEGE